MIDETVLFDGWTGIVRIVMVGSLAYVGLVAILRASGKRTLSKMSAFDLVVTVALGSTLGATLLDRAVPLADGLTALALLVGLQYVVAFLSVRWKRFGRMVKSEPSLLLRDGALLPHAMRAQRVTEEEIDAAIRQSGAGDRAAVACVVLESDGSLSVVRQAA